MSEYTKALKKIKDRMEAKDHIRHEDGCSCEVIAFCRWADSAVDCDVRSEDHARGMHCTFCRLTPEGVALCESAWAFQRAT